VTAPSGKPEKLVLVGQDRYPLIAFEAAFNSAALDHFAARTANKTTIRGIMRTIAASKSDRAHSVVLKDALTRLKATVPVSTAGDIAARFPDPSKL
jgi:hypothetical protein